MICLQVISSHSTSSACPVLAACRFVPSVRMGPGATVFTLCATHPASFTCLPFTLAQTLQFLHTLHA